MQSALTFAQWAAGFAPWFPGLAGDADATPVAPTGLSAIKSPNPLFFGQVQVTQAKIPLIQDAGNRIQQMLLLPDGDHDPCWVNPLDDGSCPFCAEPLDLDHPPGEIQLLHVRPGWIAGIPDLHHKKNALTIW